MRASFLLRAQHAQAYQPMIRFLGSRKNIEYAPHAPAPHPAAPQAVKDDFQSFLSKLQSTSKGLDASSNPKGQSLESSSRGEVKPSSGSGTSSGGGAEKTQGPMASKEADFDNFWEAPGYLWKIREVSERESEAVMAQRMFVIDHKFSNGTYFLRTKSNV